MEDIISCVRNLLDFQQSDEREINDENYSSKRADGITDLDFYLTID